MLCLAAGRTITDGDGLNLIFLDHLLDGDGSLCPLVDGWVGEDGLMVEQVALGIEAHHLTASTEAWIDAHHPFLSKRRTQ